MIRRIALQSGEETPIETLLFYLDSVSVTISDYADLSKPIKGLPKLGAYNEVYSWYLPYDKQMICSCKAELCPKDFLQIASDVLAATKCRTARLEYYQIFDNDQLGTEKSHLGMADLSGNTAGVKFQGSNAEILSAYDDILSVVQDVPLVLRSVICTYQDGPVAEIQMEFTRNVDAAAVFEDIVKQHPALRMMGCWIPEWRGDPWYVYVSGSHSPQINTISLPYDRTSENDFYEELKRSKFWGDPDWLQGDIMINVHKPRSGLAKVNPFNWSKTVEIPQTVCGRKITAVSLGTNSHITKLKVPSSVKRIEGCDLLKCIHLKEVILPGVTEIGENAFAGCRNLKDLWVSNKLKSISAKAFPRGIKPTIHAPAGSYAEAYAKEHNIPFVAE